MGNKLQFLPLITFILFPTTFIITYSIAISYDHVYPFFSYISDTGTLSPEMCWFALLLSITAISMGFVVYVRYKQVEAFYRGQKRDWLERVNIFGLILGMVTALGAVVVGSFQETNVMSMHILGTFMCFLSGSIYLLVQSFFTFKMLSMFTSKCIAILRLIVATTSTTLFIVTYLTGVISMNGFQGDNMLKWEKQEPKYPFHVASVTCEWIMVALVNLYVLSFMLDFRRISFKAPQVTIFQRV